MKNILLVLVAVLASTVVSAQNWYTFAGNNQKNGLTKLTGPVSASTAYWTVNSATSSVWGNAIYTFGDRFAASRITFTPSYRGKIEMRNLTSGSLIWEKTISDTSIMYVVGFTEDAVYACDYKTHILYAFTPDSGYYKWQINSDMFPGNTGICFADNGDPIIFGKRLDYRTGVPKWTNNYIIPVGPDGGFTVYGNTYYHWSGSIVTPKKLIAIDINTGLLKYESAALPGDGDQENDLVIGPDGKIYIARDGGALHCFTDNGSGFTENWSLTPAVLVKSFGPGNVIYCANVNYGISSGRLMRVNGLTGTVIDSVSSNIPAGYVTVGYDSTVYVNTVEAANGRYFAFTPDLQTVKFQLNVPYSYYSGCPLGKEGVFITSGSGTQLTAYKPTINRKPVADFRCNSRIRTANIETVNFFDQSSYAPTSWQWTFQGGTPSTSTEQNPTGINYQFTGLYAVKLIATNAYGSDTIIKNQYINAIPLIGIENTGTTAVDFNLSQNYPNPFNPATTIEYSIPKSGIVSLVVYDISGKEVRREIDRRNLSAGNYKHEFRANDLSSGIYFYALYSGDTRVQTRKMILIK